MKDFYNSYYKNYLKRVTSFILTICLLVSNCLPVLADSNGASGPASYSSGGGGNNSSSVQNKKGGYRFSLLFLSGKQGGSSILDSVGNVNIDQWEKYKDKVQVVGSLDVYYDGKDDPSANKSFGLANKDGISSFFLFDVQGKQRSNRLLQPSQRNMISSSELGLSDFPWKYNCDLGTAKNINEILVKPVTTGTEEERTVNLELFPNNPEGQKVVKSQKYRLTSDCAKIINELCVKSGLTGDNAVFCASQYDEGTEAYNKIMEKPNVFEKGTFNGEIGSYRLMIEPYEIINITDGGSWAMTLRDFIWYINNKANGKDVKVNLGNFTCLMANLAFMEHKDILEINSKYGFEPGKKLEDYSNKLTAIDFDYLHDVKGYKSTQKMDYVITQLGENNLGYGIASVSSEMCGVKSNDMYIGQITHIFLPGTLNDTDEVKAYSMEYRGEKKTDLSYLDQTIMTLTKAIETATEPKGLTETKKAIANSLIGDNGKIDTDDEDSAYKALTDAITDQVEKAYIPEQYSSEVKALAKDIINDNTFKDFINQIYYQNIISIGYASADKSKLYDGPLKDWVRILVMQAMIENEKPESTDYKNGIDTNENTKDTALAILPKDLENGTAYSGFGFKILNDKRNDELKGLVVKTEECKSGDYKASYKAVASKDNTLYAENNISGDQELMNIFKDDLITTETQADSETPKFIRKLGTICLCKILEKYSIKIYDKVI